ncbi:DUF805 domain-containing protein [Sulfitobacter sp. F26204]|uniref:DUF805 domain-containing protein n=1 Tax=Sulfitobacter sp. F26204 TaxID=2996014 RepID=UPI00225E50AB|nr:DUF805 domain-containing protein [Sulfitobacter sp. F26204]MCX7561027.1 DUF805 domain-containing protein [Sulfitobacter sp. F26204]
MTMDFPTAVRTCLTQKYADFKGRASRSEYWWFFLAVFIGAVVTQLIWGLLYLIFALAILCPALAAAFRRLQDTGRPGWYAVIPFGLSLLITVIAPDIPTEDAIAAGQMPDAGNMILFGLLSLVQLVISLLFLWWLTRPSQPETNAYGPPPTSLT